MLLWSQRAGAPLHCSERASYCGDFPCCGARALGHMGSVVVAHGLSCFCEPCVTLGFVTSRGEDSHLGSEMRLDYLELFVQPSFIKVLSSIIELGKAF